MHADGLAPFALCEQPMSSGYPELVTFLLAASAEYLRWTSFSASSTLSLSAFTDRANAVSTLQDI